MNWSRHMQDTEERRDADKNESDLCVSAIYSSRFQVHRLKKENEDTEKRGGTRQS